MVLELLPSALLQANMSQIPAWGHLEVFEPRLHLVSCLRGGLEPHLIGHSCLQNLRVWCVAAGSGHLPNCLWAKPSLRAWGLGAETKPPSFTWPMGMCRAGRVYEGQWSHSQMHGKGVLYRPEPKLGWTQLSRSIAVSKVSSSVSRSFGLGEA